MARLHPKPYPGAWKIDDSEPMREECKRVDKLLDALYHAHNAVPKGQFVGKLVTFPVADGKAYYVIIKEAPLTLQHVPYGDAWTISASHMRGLRLDDMKCYIPSRYNPLR